jgi:hypothetical protein
MVAKLSKTAVVAVRAGFDYEPLAVQTAARLRSAAARIREKSKRTLEHLIVIGQELRSAKEALPHGQYGCWLHAEFGWSDRMARHLMDVAEQFGPKTEFISDLAIEPAAAYLLAAPSVPYEARQAALDRATAGETITGAVAKEILGAVRKRLARHGRPLPERTLTLRLAKAMERFREQWNPKKLSDLARRLRDFADELENGLRNGTRPNGR